MEVFGRNVDMTTSCREGKSKMKEEIGRFRNYQSRVFKHVKTGAPRWAILW